MMQSNVMSQGDPLSKRYVNDSFEGIGGAIKQRPEDFIVEELPRYEPAGEGEHLYLRVQKVNVSHAELIASVRKAFGVRPEAIGFAGMKDKHAVTQQTVSVYLPGDTRELDAVDLEHERIAVLWADRHRNKLRTGHLAGTRFSIRIREVDPLKAPLVFRELLTLQKEGVPNAFGPQRFGYRLNNHVIGAMILREDWQSVLDELLGATGSAFPEYQRARRELYDAGKFAQALTHWMVADRAERAGLRALVDGVDAREACRRLGRSMLSFYVNAFQSAVFNTLVDRRIEDDALGRLVEGDLAWKHDSRSVFAVTADELEGDTLAQRLGALEVSPSGPLWGRNMTCAKGAIDEAERAALDGMGMSPDVMFPSRHCPKGARRPMREVMSQCEIESGLDEHGPYIRVAFDLPRGVYATVVLREIMKTDLT